MSPDLAHAAAHQRERLGREVPRLKVIQVLPALDGGGVEQGTVDIAKALVAAGHESLVVSKGGRMVPALEDAGSRHVAWDLGRKHPRTLWQVRPFRRWLRHERADILHVRSRLPAWVGWAAWQRMPVSERPRFVTTVHGLYSVGRYSSVMTRGERVIAVSETVRRYALTHYPNVKPHRVIRIDRGIDRQRFAREFQPAQGWQSRWQADFPMLQNRPIVVLPGRLTRIKGHSDFIAVMARLAERGVDAAGVVVGGADPKHQRYADEVKALGPNLVFTGHRTDVAEIMATATAVVSLSTHPESFGRTVVEALSLGTPVVGYDHGGVGEVLAAVYPDGAVPLADTAAVADRLAAIIADRAKAQAAIREHGYDVERMCAATLDLYRDLADER